ncbi:ATP synthase subunit I [Marinospirillum insulare]|uniref:ATP synthase subunit I n=1 Tax=Marinospirillum insulare TaxID=217169 RepID=UPI0013621FA0|nr:ATP synthase subunit I [Marinospirillum insulare]
MFKLFFKQFVIASLVCLLAAVIWPGSLLDALLGGFIGFFPQLVFGYMVFIYQGARQQHNLIKMMFAAEAVKFGLTVVLFVAVFLLVQPSNPISLLSTYAAVVLLHWLNFWLIK